MWIDLVKIFGFTVLIGVMTYIIGAAFNRTTTEVEGLKLIAASIMIVGATISREINKRSKL